MLLSIGLIVKNESTHLRNCLSCFKPLLDKVKCEIIVVDTGSTDDTVSIAREFTTSVIEKPWNDSFAEARNHTVAAAKGEWYLSIDADEYFEDVSGLISFFTTGRHKSFNTATIEIRNIVDDKQNYSTTRHLRLMRMSLGLRFIGVIHELLPTVEPVGHIGGYVNHLGYVGEEAQAQKGKRNYPLIVKAHKKDPRAINPLRYMAQHEFSEGNAGKCLEYVMKGYKIAREDHHDEMLFAFYELHVKLLQIDEGDFSRHARSLEVLEDFFANMNNECYGAIRMRSYKGICHFHLKEFSQAIAAFEKCYALLEAYDSGELDMDGALVVWGTDLVGEVGKATTAFQIAASYGELEEFGEAFTWLGRAPIEFEGVLEKYIELISLSGKVELLGEVFGRIADLRDNTEKMDALINTFDRAVLPHESAAQLLRPFFDVYAGVVSGYAIRCGAPFEKLDDMHKLCVYLCRAGDAGLQGRSEELLENVKLALGLGDRFGALVKEQVGRIMGT